MAYGPELVDDAVGVEREHVLAGEANGGPGRLDIPSVSAEHVSWVVAQLRLRVNVNGAGMPLFLAVIPSLGEVLDGSDVKLGWKRQSHELLLPLRLLSHAIGLKR